MSSLKELAAEERSTGQTKKYTYRHLFRTPAIRRNTVIMSFCWLSFSMGYFGLLYNTPALEWNMFLVFVFPSIIVR